VSKLFGAEVNDEDGNELKLRGGDTGGADGEYGGGGGILYVSKNWLLALALGVTLLLFCMSEESLRSFFAHEPKICWCFIVATLLNAQEKLFIRVSKTKYLRTVNDSLD